MRSMDIDFLFYALLLTKSTLILGLESQPCYRYDGTLSEYNYNGFDKFYPCHPDQAVSHCCYGLDICLDNGLCMGFGPALGKDRILVMGGCTDATWPLPCPQYFVGNRHNVPSGLYKINVWLCAIGEDIGEYCIGSKDVKGVGEWDASCCANASLRIKDIPWQKSMHMALDPTRKIEIFTGEFPNDPGDKRRQSTDIYTIGGIVIGILGLLVTFGIGFCQWQFPKTRIRPSLLRGHRGAIGQTNPNYQTSGTDRAGAAPVFRDEDAVVDVEEPDTSSESYSHRIIDLLEGEDGWRESRLSVAALP
jgi:hypothetical protein